MVASSFVSCSGSAGSEVDEEKVESKKIYRQGSSDTDNEKGDDDVDSIGDTAISIGNTITYDEYIGAYFETQKEELKSEDIKYDYSFEWTEKWDLSWKEDYCYEHDITTTKFESYLKENNTELYVLNTLEKYEDDEEKFVVEKTYYLGLVKTKLGNRIDVAGIEEIEDGCVSKYYNVEKQLVDYFPIDSGSIFVFD